MDPSIIINNIRERGAELEWWYNIAIPFVIRTTIIRPYFKLLGNERADNIMNQDWDNLIILDGCRYDMFKNNNCLRGELDYRISKGSNTAEFLQRNFGGSSFYDTVYVTANPQVEVNLNDPFYDIVSVWEDNWDDQVNTVRPEHMVEATREANEIYPNKRLISHFVQPHYPFIGELGQSLFDKQAGIELSKRMASDEKVKSDHHNIWDLLKRGKVNEHEVRAAYQENLQLTLPHVKSLLNELQGRTVVTSDHGNLIGEVPHPCPIPYPLYGHPPGVYADKLITVPWLTVEGGSRKEIVSGSTSLTESDTGTTATERLRDLGYL